MVATAAHLILVTVLGYTVPAYQETACGQAVEFPTERMGYVELWYAPRYGPWSMIRTKPVAGLEGTHDTIQAPDDTLASLYLLPVDAAGNRGCAGNTVTVAGRVGVPEAGRPPRIAWFDVSGRRLTQKPRTSGVYWEVKNGRPRRLVLIR